MSCRFPNSNTTMETSCQIFPVYKYDEINDDNYNLGPKVTKFCSCRGNLCNGLWALPCFIFVGYFGQINDNEINIRRELGEQLLPNKIIGVATSIFCSPIFSVTSTVKSSVRLPLTQKFSKIPQLLGLCPRPHCTLCIPFF